MATRDHIPEPSRPAPRTTYRGVVRREQILQQATNLFLVHGYAGVSVDEIIKTVGGSKTNVYRHFQGKEGLFIAVVEELCSSFLTDFLDLDLKTRNAAAGLRLIGNSLLEILLQPRHIAFQRLITAESGRYPALARAWFDAGPGRTREFVAEFVRQRQLAGELKALNANVFAALFHSMLVFDPVQLAMLGHPLSPTEVDEHVSDSVEIVMQAIQRPGMTEAPRS